MRVIEPVRAPDTCGGTLKRYSSAMFIRGVGTAAPATRYKQSECWTVLQDAEAFARLSPRSRALLRKVFSGLNGIDSRALALNPLTHAFNLTPNALHARFEKNAPVLAAQAAERALIHAGISPDEIDAVLISTCTGYLCPGLTSYVSERIGLRPSVFALDLVGQGCVAAMPHLRTAEALLASGRAKTALSICVERGAITTSSEPGMERRRVDPLAQRSRCAALQNARRHVEEYSHAACAGDCRASFARSIRACARAQQTSSRTNYRLGLALRRRDVLAALRGEFGLSDGELDHTATVLREYGSISSACVYHVLQHTLADGTPAGWWWMSAFGAGFSCRGALLKAA